MATDSEWARAWAEAGYLPLSVYLKRQRVLVRRHEFLRTNGYVGVGHRDKCFSIIVRIKQLKLGSILGGEHG